MVARRWLDAGEAAVVVEVGEVRGSVPRGTGTRMLVSAGEAVGTIGGGHLELKAIDHARRMLAGELVSPTRLHFPLGPALGQCCGGAVTLHFEVLTAGLANAWPAPLRRFHLQLYGAGHVGRAIAHLLAELPVQVEWIDERADEFPLTLGRLGGWPPHIRRLAGDGLEAEVQGAPAGAFYLVLTHRHDLDERITEAILRRGDFGFLGLIGSRTKKQRFVHRFLERGIPRAVVERMTCPIGLPDIAGKEPEVIALAAVAQLLAASSARASA
jgi:xanthine dehydrogenase accessory factor